MNKDNQATSRYVNQQPNTSPPVGPRKIGVTRSFSNTSNNSRARGIIDRVLQGDNKIPSKIGILTSKDIQLLLLGQGITAESILEKYNSILAMPVEKVTARDQIAILDKLASLMGLAPPPQEKQLDKPSPQGDLKEGETFKDKLQAIHEETGRYLDKLNTIDGEATK